jgi:hypothetical protein
LVELLVSGANRIRCDLATVEARYLVDPAYGWAEECQQRFGTHPVQVCHDRNTVLFHGYRGP